MLKPSTFNHCPLKQDITVVTQLNAAYAVPSLSLVNADFTLCYFSWEEHLADINKILMIVAVRVRKVYCPQPKVTQLRHKACRYQA